MTQTLSLQFTNESGKSVSISVADPTTPVDGVAVNDAMDNIISKNVFLTDGGELVAKKSAQVVSREVTDIEMD